MNKINTKRKERYEKNLAKVRQIITKHHTRSVKKIQIFLVEEYRTAIAIKTLERYLSVIKREKQKETVKRAKSAKVKSAKVEQVTYPYYILDPSGKKHKITGDNMTVTISWGEDGRLITYDTRDKIWRYDNNHKPFDKAKKITPRHRLHSNLSFEYDDLND